MRDPPWEPSRICIKRSFFKKETKEYKRKEEELREILSKHTCPVCKGARLSKEVLSCTIQGKNIADCSAMQISHLIEFLKTIRNNPVKTVLDELIAKLNHLENIGLSYLSLNRETSSLSGGESQRIKMVRHLGSSLTGLLYIFDVQIFLIFTLSIQEWRFFDNISGGRCDLLSIEYNTVTRVVSSTMTLSDIAPGITYALSLNDSVTISLPKNSVS